MTGDQSLRFGEFRLDPASESVWRGADEIRLRPKTFAVLRHLAERAGRLVGKTELLETVWSDVAVGDAVLAVSINEIRRALRDEARTPRLIETVHRRGYRFIAPMARAATESGSAREDGIVGRDAELRRLGDWLGRARRGQRQVGFVTGETGMGKTALVDAFTATLPPGEVWLARGQCLDHYGAGEPYRPVLEAVSRLARGPGGDRVLTLVARHAPSWLAQLPGLAGAATDNPAPGAQATRERMLREQIEMMEALAAERPLILVLEDLHWSDYSTLDLVVAVARRREPARLLLIGTYRPVDAIARGHPLRAVTRELALQGAGEELRLPPLDQPDVGRYLATRFGGDVGGRLAGVIHHRTDGLPLFVVSVADTLVRQGLLVQAGGRWDVRAVDREVETAVPDSLRQMIEHQVDALAPDEQRLLEAASVAGLTFSAASVAAGLEADLEAVEDRCEALVRREQFLRSSGVEEWPDGTLATAYRFLHVFHQQVLAERLPAARRAGLHRRIGEREEAAYRSRPGDRAAALALHFERGRDAGRAIAYRRLAAGLAIQRCAHREAVEHLGHGRQLLDTVEDGARRHRLELELHVALGPSLIALHSAASPEVETVYQRARELAELLDDQDHLHRALWGVWYVDYSHGRYAAARETGQRLLALAERAGDRTQLLQAHHALGPTLLAMGDAAAARACLERGLTLYDRGLAGTPASLYVAHDAGACSQAHLALAEWVLGYPDRSQASLQAAIRIAEHLRHPTTSLSVHHVATWVYHLLGAHPAARQSAEALRALAAEHGAPVFVTDSTASLACLPALDGSGRRPLGEDYALLARIRESRTPWRHVLSVCLLAEASVDPADAARGLDALAAIPMEHRGVFFAAEIERVRGGLLLRLGQPAGAEAAFRQALDTARNRAERSLELRAATDLARLLAGRGRREAARRVLEPCYAWFTEGFDTVDLSQARGLLDSLRASPRTSRRL